VCGAGGAALVVVAMATALLLGEGRGHPSDWDPQVADIVTFVQAERGLDFEHPVEVVFVPEEEFADSMATDVSELAEEDLEQVRSSEAQLRAFGLIDGSVDLVDSTNEIRSSGTLAYYSPEEEKVYVRGTEVTPAVEATLAHELVHVLQDQHFDLREMEAGSPDPGAVRSVIEGDADRISYAYVAQLPAADQQALQVESQGDYEDSGLDTMPDALVAASAAPYALGLPAVGVLAARGGNFEVNQVFLKPPTADVQILDPRRMGEEAPRPVELPEVPEGATVLASDETMGALFWDIVLARRLGLHQGLAFADSWDGDTSVTFETPDGRTCTASAIRATDVEAATAMLSILQAWLAAGSQPLDDTTYARMDSTDEVELGVCDPGADATVTGEDNAQAAIAMASLRLELERQALEADQTWTMAQCMARGGVAALEPADLADDADVEATQAKVIDGIARSALSCTPSSD
jgi:hypothetical protein